MSAAAIGPTVMLMGAGFLMLVMFLFVALLINYPTVMLGALIVGLLFYLVVRALRQ